MKKNLNILLIAVMAATCLSAPAYSRDWNSNNNDHGWNHDSDHDNDDNNHWKWSDNKHDFIRDHNYNNSNDHVRVIHDTRVVHDRPVVVVKRPVYHFKTITPQKREVIYTYLREHPTYTVYEKFPGRKCPPGLVKKGFYCEPLGTYRRYTIGQPLPAGIVWQQVPQPILYQLPAAPIGTHYGMIDNDIVLMSNDPAYLNQYGYTYTNSNTQIILDALSAALTGNTGTGLFNTTTSSGLSLF